MYSSTLPGFKRSYEHLIDQLIKIHGYDKAMHLAVGGEFQTIGLLEFYLLLDCGLEQSHRVIDVGCGSGRLAVQLAPFLTGRYMGIDVVPTLLAHASRLANRDDWTFALAPGLSIPDYDERADFVCFFSVFTHLLEEESFHYLTDAVRVLKPGGKIVLSFLEYSIPSQRVHFFASARDSNPDKVLTQFLSRDALIAWADHLNLDILAMHDGDKPHIPLPQPVPHSDGSEITGHGCLGQSVCVLRRPALSTSNTKA